MLWERNARIRAQRKERTEEMNAEKQCWGNRTKDALSMEREDQRKRKITLKRTRSRDFERRDNTEVLL